MADLAHSTLARRPEGAASATGRRSLFGAAPLLAMALAAPAQAVDASVDAEVIRLCAAFQAAHDASYAPENQGGDDDGPWAAWMDERDRIADLIRPLPAVTVPGWQAKAQVALALLDESNPCGLDNDGLMLCSALEDIVRGAA